MSRVNLLLDVVEDMRSLADSLQSVADSIQGNTAAPEEVPTQPVDNTPQITIEQVRTLLAEKSGEGKTQAVKALLYKYDAGKLSGVKPEDYAALMEEARKLYLYPSLYLLPTYNSTTNRTVFEGSYVGASSFSSWEDGTGNNRRMLEVRNAAYQASLDFAVLLRTCTGGTWASYRLFHAGMATPIPLANGGTGASSAKAALSNLGIFYSASLPSSGTDGQICLMPV